MNPNGFGDAVHLQFAVSITLTGNGDLRLFHGENCLRVFGRLEVFLLHVPVTELDPRLEAAEPDRCDQVVSLFLDGHIIAVALDCQTTWPNRLEGDRMLTLTRPAGNGWTDQQQTGNYYRRFQIVEAI